LIVWDSSGDISYKLSSSIFLFSRRQFIIGIFKFKFKYIRKQRRRFGILYLHGADQLQALKSARKRAAVGLN